MEKEKFAAARNKLQAICDENNFVFSFSDGKYPITLTIKPQGGLESQMAILEMADEKTAISPNASIVLMMKEDGELDIKIYDRFSITDKLFTKIKGLFRQMHFFYLAAFYRDVITQDFISKMPDIGSALTTDKITEPLEEYEDDMDEIEAEEGEAPDFPEDLLDEADEAPESEEITYGEFLFKEAAEYAREQGGLSMYTVIKKFSLSLSKASYVIKELAAAGIISDVSDEGGFRKYIEEDEDNG